MPTYRVMIRVESAAETYEISIQYEPEAHADIVLQDELEEIVATTVTGPLGYDPKDVRILSVAEIAPQDAV